MTTESDRQESYVDTDDSFRETRTSHTHGQVKTVARGGFQLTLPAPKCSQWVTPHYNSVGSPGALGFTSRGSPNFRLSLHHYLTVKPR